MVCFLGIGDCSKTTTSNVTNAVSFLSSTTMNTLASITNSTSASTTASQQASVAVGTSNDVMLACISAAGAAGFNPSSCSSLMSSNNTVSGITQDAKVVSISTASITNDVVNQLQQQLSQQIDQKMNSTTDGTADVLKAIVTGIIPGKSSTTTNTTNTVSSKNYVTQNFTVSSVTSLVNTVNSTQGMTVLVQNANNSSAKNVAQTVYISAMMKLLSSNSVTASVLDTMDQTASQSQVNYEKGIADYIDSLGNALKGILGSFTTPLLIGAAVIAGLVGLFVVFSLLPKGGPKAAAAGPPPAPYVPPAGGYAGQAYAAYQQAAPFLQRAARR